MLNDLQLLKTQRDKEEIIIQYMLNNPAEIISISERLNFRCLKDPEMSIIYKSLTEMAIDDMPIDLSQLAAHLERCKKLDVVGGMDGIAMIADGSILNPSPSQKSVELSILGLLEAQKRTDLAKTTAKIHQQLQDLSVPHQDVTKYAIKALEHFLDNNTPDTQGLEPISISISDTTTQIIERTLKRREGKITTAIGTGFIDLDNHTGGWQRGDFVVIGARPGMGKSGFIVKTCMEIARNHPVAFFSLEMTTAQMNARCLSMESGVPSASIRDGLLTDEEIDRLVRASARIAGLSYWGTDKFSTSIDFVVAESRKLAAKGKLGAIAVDYIQLMVTKQENSLNELSDITRKLKALAIELDCTVFGLSQLSRSVEARNDKRPIKSDLRDSGSIEQDSDIILMLYRDEYYNEDTKDKGIAELLIRKFRNGQEGKIKLAFQGETISFKNYAGY